ncbi:MAG: hydrogenase 3 maturation endopeptidase HyCI [Candidatus Heimdallarchaeaceae archaeon]
MDQPSENAFREEFVQTIETFFREAVTLAILGVGNEDNGDDAVGLYVIQLLQQKKLPEWVKIFYCERVPEHFLGKLEKLKPDRILVIDAADMKEIPGAVAIFPKEAISQGYHFSTHTLSLTMLEEFLKHSIENLKTMYMGIQPKQTVFETPLSEECKESAQELSELLIKLINECEK